jgi:predicted dehydrogenase
MTIGIGLVGSGFMSRTYAFGIRELVEGARLAAVFGGTRSEALARDFEIDSEPSLDALLARPDVDVVLLGSPTFQHRDQTLAAAAAGKHVFTEKPIAATLDEIDDMIRACREAGTLLGVNAVTRYRRGVRMAKRLVDDGEIGQIRMVRHTYAHTFGSYATPDHWILDPRSGSPFVDQGAHCNDAIRWFVGADAAQAFARYDSYTGTQPTGQSAMVTFLFRNGVMCQIWASYELPQPLDPDKWTGDYMFVGSKGIIDVQYRGLLRIQRGNGWETLYTHPPVRQPDPDESFAYPYAEQVQDFVKAIVTGGRPEVTGDDARHGIEMGLAADRSAATGKVVHLPLRT